MTETKDEGLSSPHVYEGLELDVRNSTTDRSFHVRISDGEEAEANFVDGILRGYEGTIPLKDEGVLLIDDVNNYSAPPGTATKLIKFGIEEGRRRGFKRARSVVFNPKIISIYEKLAAEGIVTNRWYYPTPQDEVVEESYIAPSTEELMRTGQECSAQQAIAFLQSFESDANGWSHGGVVDTIIDF